MEMRKKYLKPEVESEKHIEQTSLACNLIQGWDIVGDPAWQTGYCTTDVTKGGAWFPMVCTAPVLATDLECEPETYGIALS